MLAKLMKYEIKSTARLFLPLYVVLFVFALLNRYLNPLKVMETSAIFSMQSILQALSMTIYFALVVAVFVMTLVIIIQRFYKNLLGDEGYLMFTLPVKTWQHITSKFLTAIIWCAFSAIAIGISLLTIIGLKEITQILPQFIEILKQSFGNVGWIVLPLLVLAQLSAGIMMIYNSIALGHLFQKNRLLASFAMYCALYFIQQVFYVIFLLIMANTALGAIIHSAAPIPSNLNLFLGAIAIGGAFTAAVHFVVIHYVLKRKLNLE